MTDLPPPSPRDRVDVPEGGSALPPPERADRVELGSSGSRVLPWLVASALLALAVLVFLLLG